MSENDQFEHLLDTYYRRRVDPFTTPPNLVICSRRKAPDDNKITTYCQPNRCEHLTPLKDLADKGISSPNEIEH